MRAIVVILSALFAVPVGAFAQEPATTTPNGPAPKRYDSRGGTPDAATVQRVVATLGVGKTVDVTTNGSKKFRGKIQSIDANGFRVRYGTPWVERTFAYGEVTRLTQPWPKGAKIAIGTGIAFGVWYLAALIYMGTHAQ